jgi:hypothetical protein
MQCLQYPNHSNVDNVNNVRHQASRHFRNKNKEYLKAKIDELEINSKKRTETCIGATNILRMVTSLELTYNDEKGHLVTDFHSVLAVWRNHFSQLLQNH